MSRKIHNVFIAYFTVFTVIFAYTPVSFAQEDTAQQEAVPVETQAETQAETPVETSAELPQAPVFEEQINQAKEQEGETSPGNVTIDFKDADIHNVLRILSYKSGVNIVAGKDVEGTVTIHLTDVPWEKALDVVLKTYGFAYEREGNIIRVATAENLGKEPLKTEVFKIGYAKCEDITAAVKDMISSRGSVRFDKRSNTIIVTDIPTNIYKIQQVVEKLDEPTPQIYIEAKLVETEINDDEKLGINWTVQVTATGAKIPTTLPFDRDLNYIEGLKTKVPLSDTTSTVTTNLPSKFPGGANNVAPMFPMATPGNYTFGTLDFSQFQAVLYMLNTRSDTKVISNPRTVTLNNQEATIHVGTSIYVPEWSESTTTGSPVFSGINKTELDTGIKLKVTPHVNSKGEIVVDLIPEVSTLGTATAMLTDSSGRTINYFPVTIRTAKTQVMVKDGETIVIGGLMKEETSKTRNKVPFLGDIPILGELFKYSYDTIDTKDLLIFVTVKLVKTKDDTTPLFSDINEHFRKMDQEPTALGHTYSPDTPAEAGGKKRKVMKLLVD
ncbi:MAG: type IV pilus secretin PilQ [Candidatus Omnitrophica bacterium]|nr:type IV pilus secretin PilQ [Candidatus Omnitrophota bacterium]